MVEIQYVFLVKSHEIKQCENNWMDGVATSVISSCLREEW